MTTKNKAKGSTTINKISREYKDKIIEISETKQKAECPTYIKRTLPEFPNGFEKRKRMFSVKDEGRTELAIKSLKKSKKKKKRKIDGNYEADAVSSEPRPKFRHVDELEETIECQIHDYGMREDKVEEGMKAKKVRRAVTLNAEVSASKIAEDNVLPIFDNVFRNVEEAEESDDDVAMTFPVRMLSPPSSPISASVDTNHDKSDVAPQKQRKPRAVSINTIILPDGRKQRVCWKENCKCHHKHPAKALAKAQAKAGKAPLSPATTSTSASSSTAPANALLTPMPTPTPTPIDIFQAEQSSSHDRFDVDEHEIDDSVSDTEDCMHDMLTTPSMSAESACSQEIKVLKEVRPHFSQESMSRRRPKNKSTEFKTFDGPARLAELARRRAKARSLQDEKMSDSSSSRSSSVLPTSHHASRSYIPPIISSLDMLAQSQKQQLVEDKCSLYVEPDTSVVNGLAILLIILEDIKLFGVTYVFTSSKFHVITFQNELEKMCGLEHFARALANKKIMVVFDFYNARCRAMIEGSRRFSSKPLTPSSIDNASTRGFPRGLKYTWLPWHMTDSNGIPNVGDEFHLCWQQVNEKGEMGLTMIIGNVHCIGEVDVDSYDSIRRLMMLGTDDLTNVNDKVIVRGIITSRELVVLRDGKFNRAKYKKLAPSSNHCEGTWDIVDVIIPMSGVRILD